MSYETRYATVREDLRDILTEIGKPFGKSAEDYVGDASGFSFTIDAIEGDPAMVSILLEDGIDVGMDGGNVVLRVEHESEVVALVAPHNRTDEIFAEWGDDDLWDDKIDILRANIPDVISKVGLVSASFLESNPIR